MTWAAAPDFPGLVVKIARPALRITLLEPRERRVIFLRHIIRTLRLAGIGVEPSRIEEGRLASDYQIITGRAVADVPSFLAMVEGLATPETHVVCMQGEGGRQDLARGSGRRLHLRWGGGGQAADKRRASVFSCSFGGKDDAADGFRFLPAPAASCLTILGTSIKN